MNAWRAGWRAGISMREMTAGIYCGECEDLEILPPNEYLEQMSYCRNNPDYSFDLINNLELAMKCLTPQEKIVVELYFYDDRTFREIATELNVSFGRIRQVVAKSLRKLRHPNSIFILENMSFQLA